MFENKSRHFLKNSNLLEEIHKSKLTYCCVEDKKYSNYDVICDDYSLITPNILLKYFEKNIDSEYIVVRVMTSEHLSEIIGNSSKLNLQDIKMSPFKHYYILRSDFYSIYEKHKECIVTIDELNDRIHILREQIKDNNKNIRFNKLNKELQLPYKEFNSQCVKEIDDLIQKIKKLSSNFSTEIRKKMIEVLRSHWKGKTIEDGEYSIEHGKLTNNLVYMLMMLVDQFAKSGNWSGYTYLEDMKSSALVQLCDVALKFEESKSNNAFAYLTQIASMKFTATLNGEKTQSRIKSQLLQSIGYDATYNESAELEYNTGKEYWEEKEKNKY